MALIRGEQTKQAEVGAALVADGLDCLRVLRSFVFGLGGKKG
jgi:hypothetical protein